MMATEVLTIHPKTPELRIIKKTAEAIKEGAVVLYPTDTGFTLGCELSNKEAINRIRQIRRIPLTHSLTFLCESLSNLAEFARVSNIAFRTIKGLIPGPYTFILPASKEVPRFAQNPKRNTAGIRVPQHILSQLLLKEVGQPIISISAKIPEEELPFPDPEEIIKYYNGMVNIAVRSEIYNFVGESTIIDMTLDKFTILRHGAGITKVLEFMDYDED